MRHHLLLPPVLLALLTSGCCSYRRPAHGHGHEHADHLPGHHGYVTQLPAQPPPPPAIQPPTGGAVTPPGAGVVGGGAVGGTDDMRFELKTEDFTVAKRSTTNGVARIRKWILSEDRSVPARVCRDELVVERNPASGDTSAPWWTGESYVEIPLITEVAVPVLTPRVYEVVRVRRNTICETNVITGTVRTEKVEAGKQ